MNIKWKGRGDKRRNKKVEGSIFNRPAEGFGLWFFCDDGEQVPLRSVDGKLKCVPMASACHFLAVPRRCIRDGLAMWAMWLPHARDVARADELEHGDRLV